MTNFGATFKKARESKGISIDQISAETRISARFLLAIETEEFHLLPGGIFNRGFIRTYAEKVGLDPEQAIADYERLGHIPETIEPPVTPPPRSEENRRRLYPVLIGGVILLIVIVYLGTRYSFNKMAQIASSPAPPPLTTALPVPSSPPAPPPDPAPVVPESSPPQIPAEVLRPEPPPQVSAEALRIDVEAKETTWIKVYADGQTVNPGEILEPGMTRHFAAQDSIVFSTGNAGGVVIKINDMPAKELGQRGQVRQIRITPNNLKDFTG